MMAGRIEMREQVLSPVWKKTKKQYFKKDPPKLCYVEDNQKISGSPLWPKDSSFYPDNNEPYLKFAKETVEGIGGHFFEGHIPLSPDRRVHIKKDLVQKKPKKLQTTFVSGFLIPADGILESQIGFYPRNGTIPTLNEVVHNLKGTWLVSNLGYFLTSKLILKENEGGSVYSHNSRHSDSEHLSPSDNSYLGGFFIRKSNQCIGYPPHLGTGGVGITKEGKPVLVQESTLRGGQASIGDLKLKWDAKDVNPKEAGQRPVVLYTPAYTTPEALKASKTNNWENYRQTIGEGRINIIINNEGTGTHPIPKIAYIKEGACLQPAGAIVLSLNKSFKNSVKADAKVAFEFEPWFDKKIWDNLSCFYEGVLPLSLEGPQDFGIWLHPNACLTQETYIPNSYRREPRTVLVKTPRYFGAFAFSGRYEYSLGISFAEILPILKKIVGDIAPMEKLEQIMSLDGGSGSKLCLIKNGEVGALNWVAPGSRNRMGDPNGNTYSCLLLKIMP